jgi:hypothetical protein
LPADETWQDWKEWKNNYNFLIGSVAYLPLKSPAKRVNVMIDEALLSKIDSVTNNRSAFLSEAAKQMFVR